MSDQPYTPTTEEIRKGYIGEPPHFMDKLVGAEFDRWLADHDAEVAAAAEQRGAVKALREFADAHRMPFVMFSGKDYRVTVSDLLRETARNIEQGNRADRIANKEGDDADA